MSNKKAEFAVKILKEYAKETNGLVRSTSDLSPLEEWLLIRLFSENICKHELTNNSQGMYVCKKCGVSLEKDVQDEKDLQEIIDKNVKLFNDFRNK